MLSPKVTIIVLNWNGNEVVINCLKSLAKIKTENVDILLVDNNSTDGSKEKIQKLYPNINLLALNKNYGYAGGNNKGVQSISDAKPEYICFLNNDTVVRSNFIDHLLIAVEKYGKNKIYGPKIFFMDNPNIIWYNGGNVELERGIINHEGIGVEDSETISENKITNYITGCCLFLHWDLFIQLNGFDTRFNMYGEDVDLCLRAKYNGVGCNVVSDSVIFHEVSSSLGGRYSLRKQIKKMKAIRLLAGIHCPQKSKNIIMLKMLVNSIKNIIN